MDQVTGMTDAELQALIDAAQAERRVRMEAAWQAFVAETRDRLAALSRQPQDLTDALAGKPGAAARKRGRPKAAANGMGAGQG